MFGVAPAYEVLQLVESRESSPPSEPSKAQAATPDAAAPHSSPSCPPPSSDPPAPPTSTWTEGQQTQATKQSSSSLPASASPSHATATAASPSPSPEHAALKHKASASSAHTPLASLPLPKLDAAQCAALHAYLYALHLRLANEHPTLRASTAYLFIIGSRDRRRSIHITIITRSSHMSSGVAI